MLPSPDFTAAVGCRALARLSVAIVGLTLALAGCDRSRAGHTWRESPDSLGFRSITGLASACTECIELTPMATLGNDSGPGFLEDNGTLDYLVRDRAGRYWVGQRGNIKVYAPDGKFLTTVGRRGQGPLEFEFAQPVQVDSQGRVHVMDVRLRRETIIKPDFSWESDRRLAASFDDVAVLPGEQHRYVFSQGISTPDRLGYPLHIVSGENIIRSFGLSPRADTSAVTPAGSRRLVSVTPDGYALSSMIDEYVVEAWTVDGARVAGFELPGLNPTAVRAGSWAWDNPPPNHVGDIAYHGERFLIIVTRHRRPDWKDRVVERVLPNGVPYLGAVDGKVPSVFRSRLDMLDLNTATVVASTWYDGWIMRFVEPDLLLRLTYSAEDEPLLQVLRLTYRTN